MNYFNLATMGTLCTIAPVQKTAKTQQIKARIEPRTRSSLEQLARREHLDLSDIVRRALQEFIARHQLTQGRADAEA